MQTFAKQEQDSALICNESAAQATAVPGLSAESAQSAAGSSLSAQRSERSHKLKPRL